MRTKMLLPAGISLIAASFVGMLSGCSSMVGNIAGSAYLDSQQARTPKFPQPSPGFQPKRMYEVPYEKVWDTAMLVLENNRITTISLDKNTDYVQGETQTMGPAGILGAITTRYKYELTVEQTDHTRVRLGIICKLESKSVLGRDPASGWRDVTNENRQGVSMLETWLYEQTEKSLLAV